MLRSQKNKFGWRANVCYNAVFQSMNVVDFSFCMENMKLQCTFHSEIHLIHCFSSCKRLGRRSTPPPQSTSGRTSTSGRRSAPSGDPKNGARCQRWPSEIHGKTCRENFPILSEPFHAVHSVVPKSKILSFENKSGWFPLSSPTGFLLFL